ncbi:ATP-binding protein, partial [Bacteroidota bacterium]
ESFDYLISKNDFKVDYKFNDDLKNRDYIFHSDPVKLKLIITNILNIIISYSSKNKNLEINTSVEFNHLSITFKNLNNEVTTKYIQYLYKKISDIDNTNVVNVYSHTLALSVTKAIIDILGGRIEFSDDNLGITIILPELKYEITGRSDNGNEIYF